MSMTPTSVLGFSAALALRIPTNDAAKVSRPCALTQHWRDCLIDRMERKSCKPTLHRKVSVRDSGRRLAPQGILFGFDRRKLKLWRRARAKGLREGLVGRLGRRPRETSNTIN